MFKRFLFYFFYPLIRFMYPTRVIGKQNAMNIEGGEILASNHYSNVDVILLSMILVKQNFYYLAKSELKKNKLLAWFLKIFDPIYIDRGKADLAAMREVNKVLKDGKKIMIFPEGTRNKSHDDNASMQEMKGGVVYFATKADATILPVMIMKRPRLFRPNTVVIGKPYKIEDSSKEGKEKEMQILGEKMSELRTFYEDKIKKNKKEKK